MKVEYLLKVGGIYSILCGLLHVIGPKVQKWNVILPAIPDQIRPLVEINLYIMNWYLVIFWLILGYVALKHYSELMKPGLGRTLLASIVIFWLIRIFILQPVYIGIQDARSWRMICFFLIGLVLFAVPLIVSLKKTTESS
jgi:hypothetical protein